MVYWEIDIHNDFAFWSIDSVVSIDSTSSDTRGIICTSNTINAIHQVRAHDQVVGGICREIS